MLCSSHWLNKRNRVANRIPILVPWMTKDPLPAMEWLADSEDRNGMIYQSA